MCTVAKADISASELFESFLCLELCNIVMGGVYMSGKLTRQMLQDIVCRWALAHIMKIFKAIAVGNIFGSVFSRMCDSFTRTCLSLRTNSSKYNYQ